MAMSTWFPFDPVQEMVSLRDAINRLFGESFVRPGFSLTGSSIMPRLDVYEREQGYEIKMLLPGVKPEDVELTVHDRTLTINGSAPRLLSDEEARQVTWHLREIGTGQFARAITLPKPFQADQIKATYADGVLTIWMPFAQEALPKRIPIQSGQAQSQLTQGQMVEAGQPVLIR